MFTQRLQGKILFPEAAADLVRRQRFFRYGHARLLGPWLRGEFLTRLRFCHRNRSVDPNDLTHLAFRLSGT